MSTRPTVPVILAGGAGTRLWPLAREHHPKQLIAIAGEHTLLQATARRLVLFGVVPHRAESGFGYIRAGTPTGPGELVRAVDGFVEKPDIDRAARFVESGHHYWNSGMFVFGASRFLDELALHAPAVRSAVEEAHDRAKRDLDFLRLDAASFARSPAISVDHAVMEQTSNAVMVPLDAG